MKQYIINESTLVLFSLANKTQIYEKYNSILLDKDINSIINESCKYYGSSFKGRCDATEFLIGIKYKCPIIISECKNLIFFPTSSYKNIDCVWFNYHGIEKYYLDNKKNLHINLKNGKKIELNVSINVISNQILKSSRLESVLRYKNM